MDNTKFNIGDTVIAIWNDHIHVWKVIEIITTTVRTASNITSTTEYTCTIKTDGDVTMDNTFAEDDLMTVDDFRSTATAIADSISQPTAITDNISQPTAIANSISQPVEQKTEQKLQSDAKFHYSINIYSAKTGSDEERPEHILCEEYDTIEIARARLHQLYRLNAIESDQSKIITATFEDDSATIIYTDGYTSFYTIERFQKVNKYGETI